MKTTAKMMKTGSGVGGVSVAHEGIEYGQEGDQRKVWLPEVHPHHFIVRAEATHHSEFGEVTALATAVCAEGWRMSIVEPRGGVFRSSHSGLDLHAYAAFDDSVGACAILREARLLLDSRLEQRLSGVALSDVTPYVVLVNGLDEFFEELNTRKNSAYSAVEAAQVRNDWDSIARRGGAASVHLLATGSAKNLFSQAAFADFDREAVFAKIGDGA